MSLLLTFIVTVLLTYATIQLCRFVHYQTRLYYQLKNFPGPKISNPFMGHLSLLWPLIQLRHQKNAVSQSFYDLMIQLCDEYGQQHGLFRLWFGPFVPWIIVCDAKLARKLMSNPTFAHKATFYRIMENFATGTSLFTSSVSEAARQRRQLKQHFSNAYLESYITRMEHHTKNLCNRIDQCITNDGGIYREINKLVSTFVFDAASENLFNLHYDTIQTGVEPAYVEAIHEMIEWLEVAIMQPWRYLTANKFLIYFINLFNHMTFNFSIGAAKSLLKYSYCNYQMMERRYRQLLTIGDTNDGDVYYPVDKNEETIKVYPIDKEKPALLDKLLQTRVLSNGVNCTKDAKNHHQQLPQHNQQSWYRKFFGFIDTMWHMNMFIVAGHDTTTASITWTLYLLAHHTDAQECARKEVDQYLATLERTDKPITMMNLKWLRYLDCCIKEALRLYPVAPFLGRSSVIPWQLNDTVTIPSYTNIAFFYDYYHRQEKYFYSPNQFIPERFMLTGNNNKNKANDLDHQQQQQQQQQYSPLVAMQSITPFSMGERSCLGQQYAMQQMKIFFIHLLSRYRFEALPGDEGRCVVMHHFLTKPPKFSVKIEKR